MHPWRPQEQHKRNSASHFLAPTPNELRTLVFDYLCHSSYTETARAFVRDSAVKHLDADGDELMSTDDVEETDILATTLEDRISPALLRKDIRTNILSGRIDDAINLLNRHFPSVLAENTMDTTHHEPPSNEKNTSSLQYIPSTSVDPHHLRINLRIHAFIEAARTRPLPYNPPGTTPLSPQQYLKHQPTTSLFSEDIEFDSQKRELICRAQNLYSEANSLASPSDRAKYLAVLGDVGGLLAYSHPEESPMAPYLSQERREAIADQVEAAIFYHLKQPPISNIELCIRQTSAVWEKLHKFKYPLPPPSRRPPDIQLTVSSSQSAKVDNDKPPSKKDKELVDLAPRFKLTAFLEGRP
ncbi:CTLH/CRA C-terminal to lish motif domain-containing protein [Abortiporus biennis]|nr:CTLH/CRA C-terminal to lish motif domain-containing protein [Abortiporus biennis]